MALHNFGDTGVQQRINNQKNKNKQDKKTLELISQLRKVLAVWKKYNKQIIDLDKKMGGLHSSDLIILAGRPSMGKTSLATNIAYNIAKSFQKRDNPDGSSETLDGGIVGFYSLEMSAEQLAARILSETAEIPSEQIRRGDMTENEFRRFVEAAKSIESSPPNVLKTEYEFSFQIDNITIVGTIDRIDTVSYTHLTLPTKRIV